MKIENFFDEIVYINLDHRTDRKQEFETEIKKLGITNYTRIPGIYPGPLIPDEPLNRNRHIACGTVHKNIVQYAKDNKLNNILIFEDDVTFTKDSLHIIEKSLDDLSKINDWDLFYVSGIVIDTSLQYVTDNLVNVNTLLTNHAYAINHKAYELILTYNPKIDCAIDGWYGQQTDDSLIIGSRFKKYLIYPLVAYQRYSLSDIDFNSHGIASYGHGLDPYYQSYSKPVIK